MYEITDDLGSFQPFVVKDKDGNVIGHFSCWEAAGTFAKIREMNDESDDD